MLCKICNKECHKEGDDLIKITQLGANGVNKASKFRQENIFVIAGDYLHSKCRKQYVNVSRVKPKQTRNCSTRKSTGDFDFRLNCFLCGKPVSTKEKINKKVGNVSCANREVDIAMKEIIAKRGNDLWGTAVNGRLQSVNELRAEDAIYHTVCNSNFRTLKSIPQQYSESNNSNNKKRGRPHEPSREDAYIEVKNLLKAKEKEDEVVTLSELVSMMDSILSDSGEAYSSYWIQQRLLQDFKDEIVITNQNGRANVITFVSTVSKVLSDYHVTSAQDDPNTEKNRIISAAAKFIRNEIKSKNCDLSMYPTFNQSDMSPDYLPSSLKLFLSEMFTSSNSELKISSIGQAIMQQVRPRTLISPLQIGLAVQMHSQFGSRGLIDSLSSHGFCSSYTETLKFEGCAAYHQNVNLPDLRDGSFLHFSADNVDHNIRTLDGLDTFHGMGIIISVTPKCSTSLKVPRHAVSSEEILSIGRIEFKTLHLSKVTDISLKFQHLREISAVDNTRLLGTLWQSAWILKPQQPQWNGYMQNVHRGSHPGKSSVHFMPMLDTKSTDFSCIFTTMIFVCEQARKYKCDPILTFDQPLYWKAIEIKNHEKNSILEILVLILGSFHTLMSFLGAIGHLMSGSGLQPVLEQVYAEDTVPHILSGKAVSRARRGHLLVACALEGLKLSKIYEIDLNCDDEYDNVTVIHEKFMGCEDLQKAASLLKETLSLTLDNDQLAFQADFNSMMAKEELFRQQQADFRTSQLWFMYLDMVGLMCTFIKAERTGNWLLHMKTLSEMLPYFAASGHYLYAKSAYCYLQFMQKLPSDHPEVYKKFMEGFNVVRRSDRFWAGIGTDLMIEQELMRPLKATGGLTRGRGMTELQRIKWLLSTTTCVTVKRVMQDLTGVRYDSSEQHNDEHKECSNTRSSRDYSDAMKILQYLQMRDPFEGHRDILCIETGEIGDENVNVENSKYIGNAIISEMIGQPMLTYSFTKKDMAVTLKPRSSVVCDGETVSVDPQLLFQRLLLTAGRDDAILKDALTYELCTLPSSLFGKDKLLREADKPVLADAISKKVDDTHDLPDSLKYVLDGGSLLYKLKWYKGETFTSIFQRYTDYILNKYGDNSVVVFDGYPERPTTKDTTHMRRLTKKVGRSVHISPNIKLSMKKESFLAVLQNKQLFIEMMVRFMNDQSSITALHSDGDADLLVATTAVELSTEVGVVVIAEDTDILVLLTHYAEQERYPIFLTCEPKRTAKKKPKIWNITETKNALGKDVCNNILAIHAILGCDTTSRIHSIGKGVALQRFQSNHQFREYINIFNNATATREEVANSGEAIICMLYGEYNEQNLGNLRYDVFCKKVAVSKNAVLPEFLPPTTDAAKFHAHRVYHQVQVWKGNTCINAEDWGWYVKGNFLLPKSTDMSPAPEGLLKLIRCKGCKTGCQSNRCSCFKNGFKCSAICGTCKGVSCCNGEDIDGT